MKKGFTLIELLAVIVILAIIALIATPIIINIIEDTKEESNKRSIELYASAIKNAIASYQLTHPNALTSMDDIDMNKYYDGNVECRTININEDGTVSLAGCTVNGSSNTYRYGANGVEKEETQAPEEPTPTTTTIYRWSEDTISIGEIVEPTDYTTDASTLNNTFYLKHVLDSDNKVIESWTCVVFSGKEACTRGGSPDFYGYAENAADYTGNALILKGLESEGLSCYFHSDYSSCSDVSVTLRADSYGNANATGDDDYCNVNDDGSSICGIRIDAWD